MVWSLVTSPHAHHSGRCHIGRWTASAPDPLISTLQTGRLKECWLSKTLNRYSQARHSLRYANISRLLLWTIEECVALCILKKIRLTGYISTDTECMVCGWRRIILFNPSLSQDDYCGFTQSQTNFNASLRYNINVIIVHWAVIPRNYVLSTLTRVKCCQTLS